MIRTFDNVLRSYPPVLWVILVIALVVRMNGLTAFSLSNDELSALARLQFDSFGDVITYGVYPDFHPAGVQAFLYLWTSLFGFSDMVVRLPFALFGAGSVFLTYVAGRRLFGQNAGMLAAAALATLEFPLLYSQIARPYSPGLFFVLLSFLFLIRLSENKDASEREKRSKVTGDALGFTMSVSACMYIHYFSFLQAGLICIAGFFMINRERTWIYLLSLVTICVLFIPHIHITLNHLSKGGIGGSDGWLGPPEPDFFENYLRFALNDSTSLFWMFIILTGGFILANRGKFVVGKVHLILSLLFIVPFIIGYYYSIHVNPVLQHSILLFSFPFLLMLVFSFSVDPEEPGKVNRLPVYILLFAGMYSTVNVNGYYQKEHFSEFRKIASAFNEISSSGVDAYSVINIHHPYYIHHYLPEGEVADSFDIYRIQSDSEYNDFITGVAHSRSDHLFYAWSNMYNDPLTEQVIRGEYPCLIDSANYLSSGYRLYSREISDTCKRKRGVVYSFREGFGILKGYDDNGSGPDSGKVHLKMTPETEYGFFTSYDYPVDGPVHLNTVEVEAVVSIPDRKKTGALMVVAYEVGDETLEWKSQQVDRFYFSDAERFKVFLNFPVPDDLKRGGVFKVYCWNEKKRDLLIDDVQINFYSDRE
jgi:4-amino-4-deoxy-L-arabinose transferase-like glycosyltransferase